LGFRAYRLLCAVRGRSARNGVRRPFDKQLARIRRPPSDSKRDDACSGGLYDRGIRRIARMAQKRGLAIGRASCTGGDDRWRGRRLRSLIGRC